MHAALSKITWLVKIAEWGKEPCVKRSSDTPDRMPADCLQPPDAVYIGQVLCQMMYFHLFSPTWMTGPECWTDWFDQDNPSGTGDWEILSGLRGVYPGKICNNPLQIKVQTTSGLSAAATGNVIAT